MSRCMFCGKSAGLFRGHHRVCFDSHASAVAKIPELFTRLLSSTITAERFQELLFAAAKASYIKPKELRSLALQGTAALFSTVLDKRLLTTEEQVRVVEILEALGLPFDSSLRPYEILFKINILNELEAGNIPQRVDLADPLPMSLEDGERVIWTFNHVHSYVDATASGEAELVERNETSIAGASRYFGLNSEQTLAIAAASTQNDISGDLLVTSHHLYLLSLQEGPRPIPIRKIAVVQYYNNGLRVVYGKLKKIARVIVIDDPWFAANLISALRQHHARQVDHAVNVTQ